MTTQQCNSGNVRIPSSTRAALFWTRWRDSGSMVTLHTLTEFIFSVLMSLLSGYLETLLIILNSQTSRRIKKLVSALLGKCTLSVLYCKMPCHVFIAQIQQNTLTYIHQPQMSTFCDFLCTVETCTKEPWFFLRSLDRFLISGLVFLHSSF